MQRRAFLQTAMAGAASAAAQPPPKKADITSSVMFWTLKGSFEERLEQAARAGVQSVEWVAEHAGWGDAEIRRAKNAVQSFRLGIDVLGGIPYGRMDEFSMVDPALRGAMLEEAQRNIRYAQELEVPMLLLMSGRVVSGLSREAMFASLVEGCKRCAELAEKANVKLVIEPLNDKIETPGYFLTTCTEGVRLIQEVNHPRVRLLFDIYHEQVQAGNVIRTIREAAEYTEVFHVADNPGRHEPGTGELNYTGIFKAIKEAGYKGYIAMEYVPTGDVVKTLIRAVDGMRAALA